MQVRVFNLKIDSQAFEARDLDLSDFEDETCHGGPDLRDHIEAFLIDRFDVRNFEDVEFDYRVKSKSSFVGVRTVTVLRSEQVYGGPEEGGWFYTDSEVLRVFHVPAARYSRLMALLTKWCENRRPERRRYDEPEFTLYSGVYSPPKRRPHYC